MVFNNHNLWFIFQKGGRAAMSVLNNDELEIMNIIQKSGHPKASEFCINYESTKNKIVVCIDLLSVDCKNTKSTVKDILKEIVENA